MMTQSGIDIRATFGSYPMMQGLSKCLADRQKWLNESAEDSCAALIINTLISLRAITKVAKPNQKVDVTQDGSRFFSMYSSGGRRIPCLRMTGSKQRTNDRFMVVDDTSIVSQQKVFVWKYFQKGRQVQRTIVATNIGSAKNKAKSIMKKRIMRYKGLAKYALGQLMKKTSQKQKVPFEGNILVQSQGEKHSKVQRFVRGEEYAIRASDTLNYATLALKGGKAQVDVALKKAMNKMVSVLNQKMKNKEFLGFQKLPAPFPEVKQRK